MITTEETRPGHGAAVVRCVVVDDEPLAARLIASYIERTPGLELDSVYNSASDALNHILSHQDEVQLVFLDIQMPRLSGMELAELLPKGMKVVFTTAYSDYAVDGFRVAAVDYLLKPVSYADFMRAASRVLGKAADEMPVASAKQAPEFIVVKSEYRLLRIPVDDICYVEGLKDYVKIYTESDGSRPVLTLMSMKAVEAMLPAGDFMRVHRSYIVNMRRVRVVDRGRIAFGDARIPVSDSCRARFLEALGTGPAE